MGWSTDIFSVHLAARLSGETAPVLDLFSTINNISHSHMSFKKYIFLIGSSQEIPEALGQFTANHLMTLQTRLFFFSSFFLSHPSFYALSPVLPTSSFDSDLRLSSLWAFHLFPNLSFLPLLQSRCTPHLNSKEKKETQDLTTNMFGICQGFSLPHRNCFYLSGMPCFHQKVCVRNFMSRFHGCQETALEPKLCN